MNNCQIASRNSEEYTTFEVVKAKWGSWNQIDCSGLNFRYNLWWKFKSIPFLQVFWIHTFKQFLEDKANQLDKCDVLFYSFLGDGMFSCILLQACFAVVEEIRTIIDQCAVPVECLKIWGCRKYIIQGLQSSKGTCFGSTPSTPQFHQIVCTLQCSVVSDSLKINHLST